MIYTIPLRVVIAGSDGAATVYPAGTSLATVKAFVKKLNVLFNHAGIQFDFDPEKDIEEIRDSRVNDDYIVEGNLACAMARHRLTRRYPERVVLLFRDGKHAVGNMSSGTSYYVVLSKVELTNINSRKGMHELGHYFHLGHTHRNPGVDDDEKDKQTLQEDMIETVVEKIRAYVEDEGHPLDDGLKALEVYDADRAQVKDTPYDLGAKIFGSAERACAPNASLTFSVKFHVQGQSHPGVASHDYVYKPLNRSNPMSYFVGCGYPIAFSGDQCAIILRVLLNGNRLRLLKGCEWDSGSAQDFVSPAAVSRHPGTVAVFACNDDGVMQTKVWEESRDSYWPGGTKWFSLGGTGLITPAAVARRPDCLDLIARGIKGNILSKVWSEARSAYYPSNTDWLDALEDGGWTDGGPTLLARGSDILEVFVRFIDGTIRRKTWSEAGNVWPANWEDLGGKGVSSPAVVARRPGLMDLFTRWSDGTIRSKVWRGSDDTWYPGQTDWINLHGKGYDSPAAISRRPDKIDLFTRWTDGTIRSKVWDDSRGSWWPNNTDWSNLGGHTTSKPVIVSRNPASLLTAARWADGTVRIKVWDDSRGSWWPNNTDWSNLGGDIIGAPALVVRREDCIVVYVRWVDGTIRTKVWNGIDHGHWWPGQAEWLSLGRP